MNELREARVLIVDAQPVMRDGLAANLAAAGATIVAETGDPLAAIDASARLRPDVVLLDLSLVERHGDWVITRLRESLAGGRIIILSSLEDERRIVRALQAGADGHLSKDAFREDLIAAVRGDGAPPGATSVAAPGERAAALSAREAEVLQLIARGTSDAEIGRSLGLSESTVRMHVASILRKTGARGRTQAAIRALRQGDIQL
jgi:DNA-binding NarL/FixJ family response regulator